MRVLITGCGLIGCYTAKELMERGDEVTFFDLQPNLDYLQKVLGRELPIIRGDIRELPALIEAMQRTRAEVVIHTAGLQGNRTPYFGFQVNLIGTLNVAEAVRLTGVRRLIHASSQGVYDLRNPPVPIHEEARRDGGARVYQGGKAACEEVLTAYAATYKFELALPRFASVYGYGPYTGGGNVGMDMYAMLQAALVRQTGADGTGHRRCQRFCLRKRYRSRTALNDACRESAAPSLQSRHRRSGDDRRHPTRIAKNSRRCALHARSIVTPAASFGHFQGAE